MIHFYWKTLFLDIVIYTVDSRYSEVGYSEFLAIVNSFRPKIWFTIPDNVIMLTPNIVNSRYSERISLAFGCSL